MEKRTQIAILGAGTFVRTQYLPRLAEISQLVLVKSIWSRTQESATVAVEIARKHFPEVDCKWGDEGVDDIIQDDSIPAVAVVLAGQAQLPINCWFVCEATTEIEMALSSYRALCASSPNKPIWAVAENYRFEPAFVECRKLLADIGDMMNVQVIVEGSMNSSNPYFSSSWRRNFAGGFILDMGVHFIAGLRILVGCEITSVSATTTHVDLTLPPPDVLSSSFQLDNGCSGVFVMIVSSKSPKIFWRVVGLKGTLQLERGNKDGRHGYLATMYNADGQSKSTFYSFSGVTEELKAFINDVSNMTLKKESGYEAESRCSYLEGARDVAVLEAMLESGHKCGEVVSVRKF